MKMAMLSVYPWGGLSALKIIRVIMTHGVAMGWHDAGPLALESSQFLFSAEKSGTASWFPDLDFPGQFPINSKLAQRSPFKIYNLITRGPLGLL